MMRKFHKLFLTSRKSNCGFVSYIFRTTWDEHIIEINLLQAATLGHIDLKFSLYQPCHNPAAIQVTLLKQNTSGFGYRMKGPHSSFKHATAEMGGANETPSSSTEGILFSLYCQLATLYNTF